MKYQVAMFDFDGTLANSLYWFAGLLNELADRFGFRHVPPKDYETLRGLNPREISERLGMPLWKVPVIATYLRRRMTQEIQEISLYAGIPRALEALKHTGMTLAVVSSNAEENVRAVLGPDVAALFSDYECGVTAFGKPPKLRKVLRHLGAAVEEAIYVGDEIRDIEAAHAVALDFGAVGWGYNSLASFRRYEPRLTFENVDDLVEKLTA